MKNKTVRGIVRPGRGENVRAENVGTHSVIVDPATGLVERVVRSTEVRAEMFRLNDNKEK